MNDLPEGDLRIDVEHVMGGWVGYAWLTPIHGPIVPACRDNIYARTTAKPTRSEAVAALAGALEVIKSAALKSES